MDAHQGLSPGVGLMEEKPKKSIVKRFGWYNVTVFAVMMVGVVLWLLTPLLLWLFNLDSDIIGVLIFLLGLVLWVGGLITRLVMRKTKNK